MRYMQNWIRDLYFFHLGCNIDLEKLYVHVERGNCGDLNCYSVDGYKMQELIDFISEQQCKIR